MDFSKVFLLYLAITSLKIVKVESLFQGFNIKKEFDISLKPFEWKPISIIKEKITPIGTFGVRHGIEKRELRTLEPAPVVENAFHVEPAFTGPFLTPSQVAIPDGNLHFFPETVTVTPLLVPDPVSSPSALTPISDIGPLPPLSHSIPLILPPSVPFQSTQSPSISVTPVPSFYPNGQSISVTSLTPINSVDYYVIPNSVLPISSPTQLNLISSSPIPLLEQVSDRRVDRIVNPSPFISEESPVPVSTPLPIIDEHGLTKGYDMSNKLRDNLSTIPPVFINEIFNPNNIGERSPSSGLLNTDISRVEAINNYLKSVTQQTITLTPEIKSTPLPGNSIESESISNSMLGDNNSALIRGTKLALYFSNLFVQLMSQFFSNARLTLGQIPELRPKE